MAKIKYTKNELKKQKDELKRFKRFLPTLMLKKQQLQIEIRKIQKAKSDKEIELNELQRKINNWIALYSEDLQLDHLISIKEIKIKSGNITGIDIPILKDITFEEIHYDLLKIPLWVDKGIEALKKIMYLNKELEILNEQILRLSNELRITTQRVNLFEKIKIPEAGEIIRKIMIYLGDQQTAAVVCGKIAKKKLLRV